MDPYSQAIFTHQRGQKEALLALGFQQQDQQLVRQQPLLKAAFQLTITITLPNTVTTMLVDQTTNLPYTLHLNPQNTGDFVAQVREAYQTALQEVADQGFVADPFHSKQARLLSQYISNHYHDKLEFLWPKFPTNAIWRRQDTHKWYALLVRISKRKLGLTSDDVVTVVDFRLVPDDLAKLVDHQTYFPGYHMNKKHWYSVILDDQLTDQQLLDCLNASYQLAK